ncbi:MAG: BtrH N-terminal domain-containing protein [Firmicutes bacterium]|nr:BtrH N-terminal domain-containing protein [Bacillota bacterium]
MKKLIERYISSHRVSTLCEFGTFRDILHYYGHDLSIPMLFGISGAMGFGYGVGTKSRPLAPDYYLPLYVVSPLTPFPIHNAYRVTNVWTIGKHSINHNKSLEYIKKFVDEDRPVMVEVEVTQYFSLLGFQAHIFPNNQNCSLSIGGHVVAVIGYDEEKGTVTLVESLLKNPVEISLANFMNICSVFDCFVPPENEWKVHIVPAKLPSLKEMVYQGIRHMVHQMLHPYRFSDYHYYGLEGVEKFSEEFLDWPELMRQEQLKQSLLIIYNFMEQMYPKGGFLRKLMVEFLGEVSNQYPNKGFEQAALLYEELQNLWREVSKLLLASINDLRSGIFEKQNLDHTKQLLQKILSAEKNAILYLASILKNW